MKLLY